MRHPLGRILTVLPLFVLILLSFLVFLVEGNTFSSSDVVARHYRQLAVKRSIIARQGGRPGDDDDGAEGPSGSSSSAGPESTSSSSSETARTTSSSSRATTTSSSSTSSTSSSSFSTTTSETPSTTSSSEISSTSTSSTLSTSSSSSSSTPTSTASSSASRTSSSSTSSSRTTLQVSTLPTSTTTSVVIATSIQSRLTSSSTTSSVQTSAEATDTEAASSKGFLSNEGAMAGTFTTLGIVIVGGISAAVIFIRKRRRRSEDLDIFDTEYKEYSSGNDLARSSADHGDYFASDMTSLSAHAGSHAGAHSMGPDYGHVDYGFGLPPAGSERNSVASNHAGYGAFRSAADQRKPPMQSSGLRSEATWSSDVAYAEPAVDENQSINVVANNHDQYYASAVRVPGTAGTAY